MSPSSASTSPPAPLHEHRECNALPPTSPPAPLHEHIECSAPPCTPPSTTPSPIPHRKRLKRHESPNRPRFITFSCYQRAPLLAEPRARDLFLTELDRARTLDGFLLHAFVVMPEHVHLVVTPRSTSLAGSLSTIKRRVAQTTLKEWRRAGHPLLASALAPDGSARFWQRGGGYDRTIRDHDELLEKVIYTENNPVRRGIVAHANEWEWSSAASRHSPESARVQVDRIT